MRAIALTIIAALLPASAMAQFGEPKWDFSIGAVYQESQFSGGLEGSSLSMDSELGFGVSFNYAFSSRFSLGADMDFISPDYTAILVSEDDPTDTLQIDHSASQFNGRIKGTYTFSEEKFSPFVDVGMGWTDVDSNITSGPPVTGCWWHPWWGYICSNFYDTFSSTEFTYGVGIGLRYEIDGGGFIKASYNYWELDSGGLSGDFALDSARIEYGWRF